MKRADPAFCDAVFLWCRKYERVRAARAIVDVSMLVDIRRHKDPDARRRMRARKREGA
jgi:hypothetical protein